MPKTNLREEYALDALAVYAVVPGAPTRDVPNPVWARVGATGAKRALSFAPLQSEYGLEAWTNAEQQLRTVRGFKIAQRKLGRPTGAGLAASGATRGPAPQTPPPLAGGIRDHGADCQI